jgi:hypothetical protein
VFYEEENTRFLVKSEGNTGTCNIETSVNNIDFGAPPSVIGIWLYIALEMKDYQKFSFSLFSASTPYRAPTVQAPVLRKWHLRLQPNQPRSSNFLYL